MCKHLKVSASGFYDWCGRVPSKRAAANVTLLAQIEAAHTKSDATYGMPRIRAELADQGVGGQPQTHCNRHAAGAHPWGQPQAWLCGDHHPG